MNTNADKYPSQVLQDAVEAISSLPGVGGRSALRLALHLVRQPRENILHFAHAVERLAGGDLILKDRLAVTVSRNRKKEIQALLERWQNDRGNGP